MIGKKHHVKNVPSTSARVFDWNENNFAIIERALKTTTQLIKGYLGIQKFLVCLMFAN